jgi:hypothetical protein
MKLKLLFFCLLYCTSISNVIAAMCGLQNCPPDALSVGLYGCAPGKTETNCAYSPGDGFNPDPYVIIQSCTVCSSGYELKQVTYYPPSSSGHGTCTALVNECEEKCFGCSDCTIDTDWISTSDGYQKKVTAATCSCNDCTRITEYRCAEGYYGQSPGYSQGCTACPTGGTSKASDNSDITRCYAWPESDTDGTGSWQYVNSCYYST